MDIASRPAPPGKPKLLDHCRREIRTRRYSQRTEEAYVSWIRRFLRFHGMRHPRDLGKREIEGFLSHLATGAGVSAATQNQALAAIFFCTATFSEPGRTGSTTSYERRNRNTSRSC